MASAESADVLDVQELRREYGITEVVQKDIEVRVSHGDEQSEDDIEL